MKIVIITLTYNEEIILPFFLRHYERFADRIIIYDSGSTDRTLEIARGHPLVELRDRPPTHGEIDDRENVRIKNTAWKDCGADWVMVVDADEFLFYPPNRGLANMRAFLTDCDRRKINVVPSECWQMGGDATPTDGLLTEQITTGVRDEHTIKYYDKVLIFKPETKLVYTPGCHSCSGENLRFSLCLRFLLWAGCERLLRSPSSIASCLRFLVWAAGERPVKLLHYKWLSLDYVKRKAAELKLSAANVAQGLGCYPAGTTVNTVWVNWYLNALKERRPLEFLQRQI